MPGQARSGLRSDSSLPPRSIRRSDAVTTCVPEAFTAAIIASCERYLPVPRNSREEKVKGPM